jgi:hypothetical protein
LKYQGGASILIVPAYPLHREFEAILIATFGHKVEELVGAIDHVDAAPVAGIGVEYLASFLQKTLIPCSSETSIGRTA